MFTFNFKKYETYKKPGKCDSRRGTKNITIFEGTQKLDFPQKDYK